MFPTGWCDSTHFQRNTSISYLLAHPVHNCIPITWYWILTNCSNKPIINGMVFLAHPFNEYWMKYVCILCNVVVIRLISFQ